MVNIIVAFGLTDNSYFIASGSQTYPSELPTLMDAAVASASVGSPYHFASIGHGGRFFISGGNTTPVFEAGAKKATDVLNANLKSTTGITFGDSGAWAWFHKPNLRWQSGNIATNANSWKNKVMQNMGKEMGEKKGKDLVPILGAGGAVVLLYPNGKTPHTNCSVNVGDMLHAAEDKGLHIRYLALSPNHKEWFFVQFEDDSITWHTTGTHGTTISNLLQGLAKRDNLKLRNNSTLA